MTLPVSGQLALSQIEVELLGSSPSQLNMDNQSFRLLASLGNNDTVLPAGSQIRWSDVYGKGVKRVNNTGTASNYNLYTNANGAGYSAGKTLVIFTNSGTLGGTTASNYALTVPTSPSGFASGDKVQVVNTGTIVGYGGTGGTGGGAWSGQSSGCFDYVTGGSGGGAGGPAINVTYAKTFIDNTSGSIGGGGNGGAAAGGQVANQVPLGGPGGGGGAGFNSTGGSGGPIGLNQRDGNNNCGFYVTTSNAPGGTAGTLTLPGNGGNNGQFSSNNGFGLGSAAALTGKANVNGGAGITNGMIYGAQN